MIDILTIWTTDVQTILVVIARLRGAPAAVQGALQATLVLPRLYDAVSEGFIGHCLIGDDGDGAQTRDKR